MKSLSIPARYFPFFYFLVAVIGLALPFLFAIRLHLSSLVYTHCTDPEFLGGKIVENPEFCPSISAVIGDFMPEKAVWRAAFVGNALFTIPTIALVYRTHKTWETAGKDPLKAADQWDLSDFAVIAYVIRSVGGFGWTYVQSSEYKYVHEASFLFYSVVGVMLQIVQVLIAVRHRNKISHGGRSIALKVLGLLGQAVTTFCVLYFYAYLHSYFCIPLTYSTSNMCEWCFAFFNLFFDATLFYDLEHAGDVTFGTTIGTLYDAKKKHDDTATVPASPTTRFQLIDIPHPVAAWATDIFFGYVWLSGTIHAVQTVYYLPMVAMRITQEGVALFCQTIVLFLSIRFVLNWFLRDTKRIVLPYACVLGGFFFVDATRTIETKILLVCIFIIFPWTYTRLRTTVASRRLAQALNLSGANADRLRFLAARDVTRLTYATPLGAVVVLIVRYAGFSFDGVFGHPAANAVALFFGAVVCLPTIAREGMAWDRRLPLQANEKKDMSGLTPLVAPTPLTSSTEIRFGGMLTGAAFGALQCFSINILGSHGNIPRFVGLNPFTEYWLGAGVIAATLAGVASAQCFNTVPKWTAHVTRLGLRRPGASGCISAGITGLSVLLFAGSAVMYYSTSQSNHAVQVNPPRLEEWRIEAVKGDPYVAYLGGLLLAFAIGATWPHAMAAFYGLPALNQQRQLYIRESLRAAATGVTVTRGTRVLRSRLIPMESFALLLWAVLVFVSIYVVCFPFVPYGDILRDRFDIFLFFSCAMIAWPLGNVYRKWDRALKLAAPAKLKMAPDDVPAPAARLLPRIVVFALLVLTGLCMSTRNFYYEDAPSKIKMETDRATGLVTPKTNLTAMVWAVHFALDNFGSDSMAGIAGRIQKTDADVIGLVESDTARLINGNRDMVEYLNYNLGYRYSDYGPTTLDDTFGCAIISRYPLHNVSRIISPSPLGEFACLIHAYLEVLPAPHPLVQVYVGHNGNKIHGHDVLLQTETLSRHLQAHHHEGPSFYLGYLVTQPGVGEYYRLVQSDGEEEDARMVGTRAESFAGHEDESEYVDGGEKPNLPLVKRTTAVLPRDATRDLMQRPNPLAAADGAEGKSRYWRVEAVVPQQWREKEGVASKLQSLAEAKAERMLATLARFNDSASVARRARWAADWSEAESDKDRDARRLKEAVERAEAAGLSDEALAAFLEDTTAEDGRNSTSMRYVFPKANNRTQDRHPRFEYEDRFCEYVLYNGLTLRDWWRIPEAQTVDQLSDTEIVAVTFALEGTPQKPSK